jgi:hypothetical protein
VGLIDDRVFEPQRKGWRWVLVLTPGAEQPDEPTAGTAAVLLVNSAAMVERALRLQLSDPLASITVDVTRLAIKTAEALAGDQADAA